MFQLYVYMQLYFMFQLWNRCCFIVLQCSGTACSSCHLPLMIKWLPASSRFRTFCTLHVLPKCRHIIPVLCSLHWLEVTKPYRIQTPVTRTVLTTGGSALFRQAVFRQALFRQALFRQTVFQYGTIPPTRLFFFINFWFLFINRCLQLHPLLCYQYAETILFRLNPSATSVSGITSGGGSNLKVGGTWRARSASV